MTDLKLKKAKLSEICTLVTDGTHDTPKVLDSGIPFVKAKEIVGGIIDFKNCDHISYEDHLKVISRSKPEKGDILFAHIGASIGETAYIKTNKEFSIKNVALFKPNQKFINNEFLYYFIISPLFQNEIKNCKRGTAQPFFSLEFLRNFYIEYPENFEIQHKIAAILSAYDDLIENNTRRIKILEEMAQALYREWFIKDFHCDDATSVPLNDICNQITDGKHGDCQAEENSGYYFISCKDVKEGLINYHDARQITEKDFLETHKRTQLQPDDIVITNSGTIGRMALVPNSEKVRRTTFQKSVALLKPNKGKILPNWLFYYLQSNKDTLIEQAGGTAQKNLLLRDLRAFKVLLPPSSLIRQFDGIIQPIRYMIEFLHEKNSNLRRTRDLLLPKLISGEIDVSDLDIKIPAM